MNDLKKIRIDDETFLREVQTTDALDIFQAIDSGRDHLGPWLPFVALTLSESDSEEFVRSVTNAPESSKEYVFIINSRGHFSGLIGFKQTDRTNRKTEIGYWLAQSATGRGIATESVRALLRFAFDSLGMNRVQIKCATGNEKSKNIPKRLGFVFEGIERDGELLSDGKFTDIEVYSMMKREFIEK